MAGERILVVEDERAVARGLTYGLAAEGFEVGRPPVHERPPRSYAGHLEGLRSRGISEAALEKILYQNARALFGIKA